VPYGIGTALEKRQAEKVVFRDTYNTYMADYHCFDSKSSFIVIFWKAMAKNE
jgi:hypothetical protein